MKKILQGAAILLALTLTPALAAGAQGEKGRGHGRGGGKVRDDIPTVVRVNRRNPSPRTPRRVRRGRNTTPGVRRGPISSTTSVTTPRRTRTRTRTRAGAAAALEHNSGHGHGRVHGRGKH